jgi:hypothetical protein
MFQYKNIQSVRMLQYTIFSPCRMFQKEIYQDTRAAVAVLAAVFGIVVAAAAGRGRPRDVLDVQHFVVVADKHPRAPWRRKDVLLVILLTDLTERI